MQDFITIKDCCKLQYEISKLEVSLLKHQIFICGLIIFIFALFVFEDFAYYLRNSTYLGGIILAVLSISLLGIVVGIIPLIKELIEARAEQEYWKSRL